MQKNRPRGGLSEIRSGFSQEIDLGQCAYFGNELHNKLKFFVLDAERQMSNQGSHDGSDSIHASVRPRDDLR
jgi:hypothetical protein